MWILEHSWHRTVRGSCVIQMVTVFWVFRCRASFVYWDVLYENTVCIFRVTELVQVDAEEMWWERICQLCMNVGRNLANPSYRRGKRGYSLWELRLWQHCWYILKVKAYWSFGMLGSVTSEKTCVFGVGLLVELPVAAIDQTAMSTAV